MCGGLYLENDAELEGKKKVSFGIFPLFKTYTVTRFCSASLYHQRDWKDDVFAEENSFIVIALKSGYPLIKSLIKHLQQKTVPLRGLMVSSNIWFYSNSVLTDGHTSYSCKDLACINEVQPWSSTQTDRRVLARAFIEALRAISFTPFMIVEEGNPRHFDHDTGTLISRCYHIYRTAIETAIENAFKVRNVVWLSKTSGIGLLDRPWDADLFLSCFFSLIRGGHVWSNRRSQML